MVVRVRSDFHSFVRAMCHLFSRLGSRAITWMAIGHFIHVCRIQSWQSETIQFDSSIFCDSDMKMLCHAEAGDGHGMTLTKNPIYPPHHHPSLPSASRWAYSIVLAIGTLCYEPWLYIFQLIKHCAIVFCAIYVYAAYGLPIDKRLKQSIIHMCMVCAMHSQTKLFND